MHDRIRPANKKTRWHTDGLKRALIDPEVVSDAMLVKEFLRRREEMTTLIKKCNQGREGWRNILLSRGSSPKQREQALVNIQRFDVTQRAAAEVRRGKELPPKILLVANTTLKIMSNRPDMKLYQWPGCISEVMDGMSRHNLRRQDTIADQLARIMDKLSDNSMNSDDKRLLTAIAALICESRTTF